MKELFITKIGEKLIVKKRILTFLAYFIISFLFALILTIMVLVIPANNWLIKVPFYLIAISIFITSFKYLKPIIDNQIILFDKRNGIITPDGINKNINDLETIQLLYKHQLDNNICILKIIYNDTSEHVIIKSDASLSKNLRAIGVQISKFTGKPFSEIGTPWLLQ
jgi:hypothetical protein